MSGVSSSVSGELDMDAYEVRVLREYYSDHAFFLSTEWFLKVLAVMGSIALSGLFLGGGSCAGAALAAGGAGVALAAAAAQALLCAAQAFQLPARAPRAWLFADITVSVVMGAIVLVSAILSAVFCEMGTAAGYLLLPLGVVASALLTGSAGATYAAATRRLDAARPRLEPPRPRAREQDA